MKQIIQENKLWSEPNSLAVKALQYAIGYKSMSSLVKPVVEIIHLFHQVLFVNDSGYDG